jgi:hypothetical protein
MVLVIRGATRCAICHQLLVIDDDIVAFPPFVSNRIDPLYRFSDAAFHARCFHANPLSEDAERRRAELASMTERARRLCVVCGVRIEKPDEYLALGHLGERGEGPLERFNYLQFHRQHLPQWPDLGELIGMLEEAKRDGRWDGPAIDWLLDELRRALERAPRTGAS